MSAFEDTHLDGDHSKRLDDVDEYNHAKDHLSAAAREVANLRPRGPDGHFVSEKRAGIDLDDDDHISSSTYHHASHHSSDHHDRRHDFDPREHPRDADGRFISKEVAEAAEKIEEYVEAKNHLAEAAREVARLRPRGPDGHFVSEEDAGLADDE